MKVCTKCGAEKDNSDFYKSKKTKDGLRWHCNVCSIKERDKWRAKNRIKNGEAAKKWYHSNLEKARELAKSNNKKYSREQKKVWQHKSERSSVNELSDSYIKKLLKRSGFSDCSKELINAKREVIRFERTIKNKKR